MNNPIQNYELILKELTNICSPISYRYNARKQGIKDKIIEMMLNSSGVRDIGRVLKISKDTVVAVLKKRQTLTFISSQNKSNQCLIILMLR
ncbi:hypothetical protein EZS27_023245 [termite gut metagenome]|uniref:Insertion element IS1 protein InsA helix-turn-helix domain-containing protein n=1 Tax=termite gut metagenome TaxID=433724 RepID=A0A5J4R267_9ZZZZ